MEPNSGKTVVILQPGYLPWLGFFDLLRKADIFVIYDDVQYTKRDWRSRNRIKTPNGPLWLSVPVITRNKYYQLIKEAEINNETNWRHDHLKSLKLNYGKSDFFSLVYPFFEKGYSNEWKYLLDADMYFIREIGSFLGIDTNKIVMASSLGADGKKSERLLNICLNFNTKLYITGNAAEDYIDIPLFNRHNIEVQFHNYNHPVYAQLFGDFVPYLSAADLLFNCGPESMSIITRQHQ